MSIFLVSIFWFYIYVVNIFFVMSSSSVFGHEWEQVGPEDIGEVNIDGAFFKGPMRIGAELPDKEAVGTLDVAGKIMSTTRSQYIGWIPFTTLQVKHPDCNLAQAITRLWPPLCTAACNRLCIEDYGYLEGVMVEISPPPPLEPGADGVCIA